jgi:hypothetical protein
MGCQKRDLSPISKVIRMKRLDTSISGMRAGKEREKLSSGLPCSRANLSSLPGRQYEIGVHGTELWVDSFPPLWGKVRMGGIMRGLASVVFHAVLVLSKATLARCTFATMSCADFVQTNGLGAAL